MGSTGDTGNTGWRAMLMGLSASIGMLACAAGIAAPASGSIEIRDAWVRWLPGNLPAGGYLTLTNNGDASVSLVGASSADYGSISIHQSREHNGAAEMLPVGSISVAGHSTLEFAAHGYHLMLLQPKQAFKPGDHVVITLKFASGASLAAQFELRPPDASEAMH
jgi:copper(I)-binding protein